MNNDSASSHDPILDHVMGSHAFKGVVWAFFASLMGVGLAVVALNVVTVTRMTRIMILINGGGPALVLFAPFVALCVLPFSRRLG